MSKETFEEWWEANGVTDSITGKEGIALAKMIARDAFQDQQKEIDELEYHYNVQCGINLSNEKKIQDLEAKLAKAVEMLKNPSLLDYLRYKCKCLGVDEVGCWDCQNSGWLTANEDLIESLSEIEKTLEEIEKGE